MFDDSVFEKEDSGKEIDTKTRLYTYDEDLIVIDDMIYMDSGNKPNKFYNEYIFYQKELYYCCKEEEEKLWIIPYKLRVLTKGKIDTKLLKKYNLEQEKTRLVVDRYRVTKPYIIPV